MDKPIFSLTKEQLEFYSNCKLPKDYSIVDLEEDEVLITPNNSVKIYPAKFGYTNLADVHGLIEDSNSQKIFTVKSRLLSTLPDVMSPASDYCIIWTSMNSEIEGISGYYIGNPDEDVYHVCLIDYELKAAYQKLEALSKMKTYK